MIYLKIINCQIIKLCHWYVKYVRYVIDMSTFQVLAAFWVCTVVCLRYKSNIQYRQIRSTIRNLWKCVLCLPCHCTSMVSRWFGYIVCQLGPQSWIPLVWLYPLRLSSFSLWIGQSQSPSMTDRIRLSNYWPLPSPGCFPIPLSMDEILGQASLDDSSSLSLDQHGHYHKQASSMSCSF